MTQAADGATRDDRVLFLPLTDRDAKPSRAVLQQAGIELDVCASFDALLQRARSAAPRPC